MPLHILGHSLPVVRYPRPWNLAANRLKRWCELTISTETQLFGDSARDLSPRGQSIQSAVKPGTGPAIVGNKSSPELKPR